MDLNSFNKNLKSIYWDIIRGCSQFTYKDNVYYIKHLGSKDAGILEEKENSFYSKAKDLGIPTNEEKLQQLVRDGLYDSANDKAIENNKITLAALKTTRGKLFLTRDLENIDRQITSLVNENGERERKKNELLDTTAEIYSNKRMNEFYVYYSVYSDEKCEKLSFNYMEFEELDQNELFDLIDHYAKFSEKFSSQNLKRIAVNNFFLNYYYLSEDNPYYFYGKNIANLSFYQIELFGFARYFRNLMEKSSVKHPEEYNNDPDKLLDWYESGSNMEKIREENNQKVGAETAVQAMSIVGASKEDLKKLVAEPGTVSLAAEAAKHGGTLTFEQIMKLHGV